MFLPGEGGVVARSGVPKAEWGYGCICRGQGESTWAKESVHTEEAQQQFSNPGGMTRACLWGSGLEGTSERGKSE